MRELRVDYGQASIVKSNMSTSLSYLEDEISKINSAINEIESLNRSYGKTSTILNELYDQKKKAQQSYDEMQEFSEKFSKFISNVKTTDTELAKKFTSDVKTYCKKNNIEITSELDAFLDKVQVALDLAGWLPIVGDVADGINAAISLCRGNYLEALICVVAMLPFGDMLKSLKYADEAKGILKYGDEFLKRVKTVAKEGSEKLSKQMSKVIKSGKLDNVIASMDAGKHYIVKMRDGTVTAIEKTGLPEKIRVCLGNGCFIAGTLVTTKSGLKPIEEIVIGDYVLSINEETGENSYKKITDTLVRSTQEICTIELENGNIKSTTGHLFMVKDKWWKAAVELVAGDVLVTSDGEEQVVKSVKVEEKGYPVITYNLTVEDNHTFFVNEEGILTHNMNNVLKGCNFVTETSEKLTKGAGKADTDIPSAFKQKEFASSYEARITQTPADVNVKVGFEGNRGESLCSLKPPPDPELKQILDQAGINGIQYKNGVPDFSPVSKAEVEINYMLGGNGVNGTKARNLNFEQANIELAKQLNKSPELASEFGMVAGNIKASDIEKYRIKNNLTWHELNDTKTMQLVPTKINSTFGHLGGVGEINAGAYKID